MDNITRRIFGIVLALLLMYALSLFHSTRTSLVRAEAELGELYDQAGRLREENDQLSERISFNG